MVATAALDDGQILPKLSSVYQGTMIHGTYLVGSNWITYATPFGYNTKKSIERTKLLESYL